MKKRKLGTVACPAAIVALVISAWSAQAATMVIVDSDTDFKSITSTVTASSTTSGSPSKTASVTNDLQTAMRLDQFDASLGTLTRIDIVGRVILRSFEHSVSVTCRDDGLINSDCASESASQSGSSSAGIDFPFDGISGFSLSISRTIDPSEFANFIGTGSILVPWRISYRHTVSADCNPSYLTSIELCQATGSMTFTFDASTTVRYTYEEPTASPVPLPAGMPLLLASLGGLAILRRKR